MSPVTSVGETQLDDAAKVEKLRSLIEKIRFCMMTTSDRHGELHSRPMSFVEWSKEGNLLFFTSASSSALREAKMQPTVNLSFCEPSKNVYVSLLGETKILKDPGLKKRLFSPIMYNWFPGGPEDPNLRLLSINPIKAEYWDGLSGLALLLSMAKARVTHERQATGEHEFLDL